MNQNVPIGPTTLAAWLASLGQWVAAIVVFAQGHGSPETAVAIGAGVTGTATFLGSLWGRYAQSHKQIAIDVADAQKIAGDLGVHVTPQSIGEEVARALEGKALVVSSKQ
jgi:hypothetical protein